MIHNLSVYGLHYNKEKEDKIYEENPINIVNTSSFIEKPQILSSLKKSSKESMLMSNIQSDTQNLLQEKSNNSKHKIFSSPNMYESKFISNRDLKNISKKLIFSPEKISYYNILSKAGSLSNYDLELTKELNKYSSEVVKSFSNYNFIKKRMKSRIHLNIKTSKELKCEFIIYDQSLLKVAEGFQFNYIPRYCRVTDKSFQYFKNEINAFKISRNPLTSIPFSLIEQVRIINFKPIIDKTHYFFEVFSPELQKIKHKLLPSDFQNEEDSLHKPASYRQVNKSADYSVNKRNYFVNASHLMREVQPGFDQEEFIEENFQLGKQIVKKGIHFKTQEELKEYALFKKEKSSKFLNPCIVNLMRQKKVNNTIKYDYNWTYREIDWYLGEKHFIFAVDNVKDLKKWVLLLNWVISKNRTKS